MTKASNKPRPPIPRPITITKNYTYEDVQKIRELEQQLDIPCSLRMILVEKYPLQDGYQ